MTTSGGSRGEASGSDGDGGAGDRDDDVPQLRAMRSVWISMREEAPPGGGLAELLAAARAKAETLQRPTVWQRMTAGLRRSPVLALVTVLVVVGGAVLVGRHADRVEVRGEVTESASRASGSASASTEPPTSTGRPREDLPAKEGWTGEPGTAAVEVPGTRAAVPGAAATPGRDSEKADSEKADATVTPNTSPTENATRPRPAPAKNATRPRPAPDHRTQLYEQCESAALRGDCVAVKRIVGRITATDRGYRARLAKDSAVAKCLAE